MLYEPGHRRFFVYPFQFIVPRTLIILLLELQCLNSCVQRQITLLTYLLHGAESFLRS